MQEEIKNDKFSTMRDLHSIVSAFKGLQMQESLTGFFKIRECCGAHGFSNYSNIPNVIEIWSPNVTLEGDTVVMYLQTAKGFIKTFRLVQEYGKKIKGIYKFLNDYQEFIGTICKESSFNDCNTLLKLLQATTIQSISKVSGILPDLDDEIKYDITWNKTHQIDIINASLLNAHYLVASMFAEELQERDLSPKLKEIFYKMLKIYICEVITKYGSQLILTGYLSGSKLMEIKDLMNDLIEEVRPHAYKLTSAYIPHHALLHSAIAQSNGKISEKMYEVVSGSRINTKTKLDCFDNSVRPLQRKLLGIAKI